MASKAIKLYNGSSYLLPVTTADLVQYRDTNGTTTSYTSVQNAIQTITGALINDVASLNTHENATIGISYTSNNGIKVGGAHTGTGSVKINAGTGINIENSTTDGNTVLTIKNTATANTAKMTFGTKNNKTNYAYIGPNGTKADTTNSVGTTIEIVDGNKISVSRDSDKKITINHETASGGTNYPAKSSAVTAPSSTTRYDIAYISALKYDDYGHITGYSSEKIALNYYVHPTDKSILTINNAGTLTYQFGQASQGTLTAKASTDAYGFVKMDNSQSLTSENAVQNKAITSYITNNYLLKSVFDNYTASGMKFMGDYSGSSAPSVQATGYMYHVTNSGGISAIGAECNDFIVSYYNGTTTTWSVWDKNVNKNAFFGGNEITTGNGKILVPSDATGLIGVGTVSNNTSQLKWNQEVTVATIAGQTIKVKQAEFKTSISGTKPSGANVVSDIVLSKGDTSYELKISYAKIDTNVTSKLLVAKAANSTTSATTGSGDTTYINHLEGSSINSSVGFKGDNTWIKLSYDPVNSYIYIKHDGPTTGTATNATVDANVKTGSTTNTELVRGTSMVLTGVKFAKDSKGHITGLSYSIAKVPALPEDNDHDRAFIVSNPATAKQANATGTSNGMFVNVWAGESEASTTTANKHSIKFVGKGGITVTSATAGIVDINMPTVTEGIQIYEYSKPIDDFDDSLLGMGTASLSTNVVTNIATS